MRIHEKFEELCSLAVIGDLSPDESQELQEHLRQCANCRAAYGGFVRIAEDHLPAANRRPPADQQCSQELRERVLSRVRDEGLRISPEAVRGRPNRTAAALETLRGWHYAFRAHLPQVALVATVVVVTAVGANIAWRTTDEHPVEIQRLQTRVAVLDQEISGLKDHLHEASLSKSGTSHEIGSLEQELSLATARASNMESVLQRERETIRRLEADLARTSAERSTFAQKASTSDAELASVRSQIEQLRAKAAEGQADLVAQQVRIADLGEQLKVQKAALDREQQLLAAGRDIRDLMGARNLHIIDVHDLDARGGPRPFGRIFLTEGKRLIFYAYDLDKVRVKNAAFHVWGEKDDGSRAAVNLGILFEDDHKQSRWALKVEDPDLLKAIDSIFVTVEAPGGGTKPKGKKLMYAYLRNPINHP